MPEVWSFLEIEDNNLSDIARKMASEASRTARIFTANACGIILGPASSSVSEELRWYGLQKLYQIQCPSSSPEIIAQVLSATATKFSPQMILFADTPIEAEIAARTAANLETGLISHCVDFELEAGRPCARRIIYNGKVHSITGWSGSPPYLATVDLGSLEDVRKRTAVEPEVVNYTPPVTEPRVHLVKKWEVDLADLDMSEARIVIGVGGGVKAEFMDTVTKLSESLKGVIGGSRIAVFSGLVPVDRQIGTTGEWLNSEIYLAVGISGAAQHIMGVKEVKNIIAINISKQAPILRYSQLGIVGDLYEIVPRLISLTETGKRKKHENNSMP
jgi:electron transfer flavoprotein alpha subunit